MLHDRWNTPYTMPSLEVLDVANNNLIGTLPTGWGGPQSVLITQGTNSPLLRLDLTCMGAPDYSDRIGHLARIEALQILSCHSPQFAESGGSRKLRIVAG